MEAPPNGWFRDDYIVENPIEMNDLGVPLFCEISIYWIGHASRIGWFMWGKHQFSNVFLWAMRLVENHHKMVKLSKWSMISDIGFAT